MELRPSLAYRKNQEQIWNGSVPEKYKRIVPFVTGRKVLEIGAAEGVLSLTLAELGKEVVGVELRPDRHNAALQLQQRWWMLGRDVKSCQFICDDIRLRPDLLDGVDTLVAVRCIYYLRGDIIGFFTEVAGIIPQVVLCGNPGRWPKYKDRPEKLGRFNYYASLDGMRHLLETLGYKITHQVAKGDPIVAGAW